MDAAKCFLCLEPKQIEAIKIQALCNIATQLEDLTNTTTDAVCNFSDLVDSGKCFLCLDPKQMEAAKIQVLCNIRAQLQNLDTLIARFTTDLTTIQGDIVTLQGDVTTLQGDVNALELPPTHEDLVYNANTVLDFDGADYQTVALTGNIDFSASSNRPAAGYAKAIAVIIEADANLRTLAFNANWTFMGTAPTDIAANKVGVLSLSAVGAAETDVVASYHVED